MGAPGPSAASRLFHTIAVVGASLGCGGAEGVANPSVADASAEAGGDAVEQTAAPMQLCDCPRPGEFRCKACVSGTPPIEGRCPDSDGRDCTCDSTVAIAAPTDCAHPEQFVCASSPDGGVTTTAENAAFQAGSWFAFADCTCDTTRPIMASQCTCEQCTLHCASWSSCAPVDAGADAGPSFGPIRTSYPWACACENLPPPVTIAPI
jgi:hypothetical protein